MDILFEIASFMDPIRDRLRLLLLSKAIDESVFYMNYRELDLFSLTESVIDRFEDYYQQKIVHLTEPYSDIDISFKKSTIRTILFDMLFTEKCKKIVKTIRLYSYSPSFLDVWKSTENVVERLILSRNTCILEVKQIIQTFPNLKHLTLPLSVDTSVFQLIIPNRHLSETLDRNKSSNLRIERNHRYQRQLEPIYTVLSPFYNSISNGLNLTDTSIIVSNISPLYKKFDLETCTPLMHYLRTQKFYFHSVHANSFIIDNYKAKNILTEILYKKPLQQLHEREYYLQDIIFKKFNNTCPLLQNFNHLRSYISSIHAKDFLDTSNSVYHNTDIVSDLIRNIFREDNTKSPKTIKKCFKHARMLLLNTNKDTTVTDTTNNNMLLLSTAEEKIVIDTILQPDKYGVLFISRITDNHPEIHKILNFFSKTSLNYFKLRLRQINGENILHYLNLFEECKNKIISSGLAEYRDIYRENKNGISPLMKNIGITDLKIFLQYIEKYPTKLFRKDKISRNSIFHHAILNIQELPFIYKSNFYQTLSQIFVMLCICIKHIIRNYIPKKNIVVGDKKKTLILYVTKELKKLFTNAYGQGICNCVSSRQLDSVLMRQFLRFCDGSVYDLFTNYMDEYGPQFSSVRQYMSKIDTDILKGIQMKDINVGNTQEQEHTQILQMPNCSVRDTQQKQQIQQWLVKKKLKIHKNITQDTGYNMQKKNVDKNK